MAAKAAKEITVANMKIELKNGSSQADVTAKFGAALTADPPPTRRRYQTNDATVEKLGELLNENPTASC